MINHSVKDSGKKCVECILPSHIVTLVKRSGILTNVLTGSKLQETDPAYSLSVLESVQQLQGHIFIIESESSVKTEVSSNGNSESSGAHSAEPILEDEYKKFDVSRLRWSLISTSQRSVPEMYNILICNRKYEAAINFSCRYGLDEDEVFKSQWFYSSQGIKDVNMPVLKIKDHQFILSECIDKVGPSEDAVKALLACGLTNSVLGIEKIVKVAKFGIFVRPDFSYYDSKLVEHKNCGYHTPEFISND